MNERHVEINSPLYTYKGKMTQKELNHAAVKYKIMANHVVIAGLVMYGWDEVEMMWAISADDPMGRKESTAIIG